MTEVTEPLSLDIPIPHEVSSDHVYSIFYTLDRFSEKLYLSSEDYQMIIKEMMSLFARAGNLGGENTMDVLNRLEHFFYMREHKKVPGKPSLVSPYVSGLDLTKQ